ncbi:MAG: TIGR00282 family metallophosphoesterase [Ruminococcaceae bacterium]|nr:TIGR00282 family metallophosphoesterase [Oscillospiraceae bacterium]
MHILAIGDIVGDSGTELFLEKIDELKQRYQVDFCIVNGENACTGNGINRHKAELLLDGGADVLTLGNHTFRQKEATALLAHNDKILRPLNFPPETVGKGAAVYQVGDVRIGVINLLGRVHMDPVDCPYRAVDAALKTMKADLIFVDFHAETTSEKVSMGWHLDGRVTAVFGTHTHVQTADEWVLPGGTGYITDLGMTGPIYSCLGVKKEITLERFITAMPRRFEFADGKAKLCGALFCVDEKTGKTQSVERVCEV